jgi:putative ABC transport system permease protein
MDTALLLLRRFSLRHWRMAPGQNGLLVLILALGVAVFTAIRLANHAAVESFASFTTTLTGRSDWIIQAPTGSLPEGVLGELRSALGDRAVDIVPVVETTASPASGQTRGSLGSETYTLLGVDLIGVSNLPAARGALAFLAGGPGGEKRDFWAELRSGPRLWVPPQLARGNSLSLIINEKVLELPVAGVIPTAPEAPPPPGNLLIMDLPRLQALLGGEGRLSRVEFTVGEGPHPDGRRAELEALLTRLGRNGARWTVQTPGARRESAALMTAAFRLNLTILSLIALLVGLYLIFQALDGAVVRRRGEIAILRSLGVDASTVRNVWLLEAAALGLIGGGAGLLLGWLGAQAAVRAVGNTVNALYFSTTVRAAGLDAREVAIALGLGMVASLLAGWWPAREAALTPPAQILGRSGAPAPGAGLWRSPANGLLFIAAGVVFARLPPLRLGAGARFPLAGYASALAWILGGGMVFASTLPWLARAGRPLGRRTAAARVAVGHLGHPSGRHRLAAAAILCAVGMSAGMAVLVASFEHTMKGWVARALQADLYMSSAGVNSASAENRISAVTWRALAAHEGVADTWIHAAFPLQLGNGPPTTLTGTDMGFIRSHADFPWVEAPRGDAVFDRARNGALVLVTESFSGRFDLHRGDALSLPTPAGPKTVTIAGVYADYGNERGSIMVERGPLAAWMGDDSATHVSLFVKPGVNPDALRAVLQREYPGLRVYSHAVLRSQILKVFRQTFSITYALELIGVAVAVAGLALAMTSVLLDRRDELTTLRALGFGRHEIALSASLEGLAVAAWAVLGGLLLSIALGWLLIHVINKQSFGWTLGFAFPWIQLSALAATVGACGWAVSYAVGFWGTNLPADQEE